MSLTLLLSAVAILVTIQIQFVAFIVWVARLGARVEAMEKAHDTNADLRDVVISLREQVRALSDRFVGVERNVGKLFDLANGD